MLIITGDKSCNSAPKDSQCFKLEGYDLTKASNDGKSYIVMCLLHIVAINTLRF